MSLRDQLLRDAAETSVELDQFGLVPVDLLMEGQGITKEEAVAKWQAAFNAKYPEKGTATGLKAQLLRESDELSHLDQDPMATQVDVDLDEVPNEESNDTSKPKLITRKGDLLKLTDLDALKRGIQGAIVSHHGTNNKNSAYTNVAFSIGEFRACARFLDRFVPPAGAAVKVWYEKNGRFNDIYCEFSTPESPSIEGSEMPF